MKRASTRIRVIAVLSLLIAAGWWSAAPASAAPTSDFTASSTSLVAGQSATFTFTGSCDVPPCRITWRYFTDGGSHLGTTMGEGPQITFTFGHSGSYGVVAKITNATSTHGSDSSTQVVQVREVLQDQDRRIDYNGWRGVSDPAASGGGYRLAATGSPRVSFAFTGTRVRYVARTGPDRGIANVLVDGASRGTLNLYAATPGSRALAVTGLTAGTHRILVLASGNKDARSTGTAITLDEFTIGTAHFDDTDSAVIYNGWAIVNAANADAGTTRATPVAGASTRLVFTGTKVTWVTSTGRDQGQAAITIDGRSMGTVDNFSAVRAWRVPRVFGGLTFGTHTIVVTVLGTHNASSSASRIMSDAFMVV